jgi:hypothetical protein
MRIIIINLPNQAITTTPSALRPTGAAEILKHPYEIGAVGVAS